MDNLDFPGIPLLNEIDKEILMHKEIHFQGEFPIMLAYYRQNGKGTYRDFTANRIEFLENLEKSMGTNLAKATLPDPAHEKIKHAREVYTNLKDLYDESPSRKIPLLLANLILSEEELPEKEIHALTHAGNDAVGYVCEILKEPYFYDVLYPGYGKSPALAALVLKKMQDPSCIPTLFQALSLFASQENEDAIIDALVSFGSECESFIIKKIQRKPFSKDNENAAIILNQFPTTPELAHFCIDQLLKVDPQKHEIFCMYLLFTASAATDPQKIESIKAYREKCPPTLQNEINLIFKNRR